MKIKHNIGGSPGVTFNLPTTNKGDNSILEGKVLVDIYGLKCSRPVSFSKAALTRLSSNAVSLYSSLKGNTLIESECKTFKFRASAGSTGNIKFDVAMKKYQFSQPNNAEWEASGIFYSDPECLKWLIEIGNEIKS
jgi:hypothetical protein